MAGRGGEVDAVAAEVEVDVTRGVELHLARGVAAGRHLSQLEGVAEEPRYLLADAVVAERYGRVAGAHDERLA